MLASKFDQFFNFTSHFAKGEKVIQIFSFLLTIFYGSLHKALIQMNLKNSMLCVLARVMGILWESCLCRYHANEGEVLEWLTCYFELSKRLLVVNILLNNSWRSKTRNESKITEVQLLVTQSTKIPPFLNINPFHRFVKDLPRLADFMWFL